MSAFDDFETAPIAALGAREARLAAAAAQYVEAVKAAKEAKQLVDEISEKIAAEFPGGVGSFAESCGGYSINVERREIRHWDSAMLESLVAPSSPMPHFITKKCSISREDWDALNEEARAMYGRALTVLDGSPRIKVRRES